MLMWYKKELANRFSPVHGIAVNMRPDEKLADLENFFSKSPIRDGKRVAADDPFAGIFQAFFGLPQGANTSPFLSILVLKDTLFKTAKELGANLLMYADDGVFYGKTLSKELVKLVELYGVANLEANIKFHQKKSGWVKRDGVWLKPWKYLGLVYDGNRNKWMASTRKGSTLEHDKEKLIQALVNRQLRKAGGYTETKDS